ncbi:MAG: flagellar basal body P-ring protein FlgI [Gemmataceae bacterium]
MVRRFWWLAAFAAVGCMQQQVRSQKPEAEPERETEIRTVGDLTTVSNAAPIPVIGVGLVTHLNATGGGVPPGNERAQLENELKKLEVTNINELFTSKTTSLVRVSATIPPGARKGEAVDIFVSVPDYSRTTSLRGGKLLACYLYSFESSQNISNDPNRADRLLRGHPMVKAEGLVLSGMPIGPDDDQPSQRAGKIWGGGKVTIQDRPFILEVNPPSVKTAVGIAERINETFHGPGSSAAPIATAKNDTHIVLNVPGTYRLNMGRFLRVVRLIPLEETPKMDAAYVQRQVKQLTDPATCITAALRLEALGPQVQPALKMALASEESMVRFAAAESLAYLGSPSCAEELAKQAADSPLVQAYALTALASLNESVCRVKLQELMAAPVPEVRYGAFRALRTLDDRDPAVAAEEINKSFWLHRVATESSPQIHVATGKRPEVVLFGSSPAINGPVAILAGSDFTLTAKEGEDFCTLSRFSVRTGKQSRKCSLELAEVMKALGELGGDYADALELLRQCESSRALNCAVKFDALPKAPTVHELAKNSAAIRGKGGDVGPGPSLYDSTGNTSAVFGGPH